MVSTRVVRLIEDEESIADDPFRPSAAAREDGWVANEANRSEASSPKEADSFTEDDDKIVEKTDAEEPYEAVDSEY